MNSLVGFALKEDGVYPGPKDKFDANDQYKGNTNIAKYNAVKSNVAANTCSSLSGSQKTDCEMFYKHRRADWTNPVPNDGKNDLRVMFHTYPDTFWVSPCPLATDM